MERSRSGALKRYGGFSLPGRASRAGGALVYHVILKFLPVQAELFDKILL
jgi:hypothetical protein